MLMDALWSDQSAQGLREPKWGLMIAISAGLHMALFSAILFAPQPFPTRSIKGVVYEVSLVEMPPQSTPKKEVVSSLPAKKGKTIAKQSAPARQIATVKKEEEKPVVIAKRTLEKKELEAEKPKTSPSALIEQALSKIERKVKKEETVAKRQDPIDQAVSNLAAKVKTSGGQESLEGGAAGVISDLYRVEVEDWIKSNWSYPVGLLSPSSEKDLETIVVLKVKSDGHIMSSTVAKRSANVLFDQSVLKAIERSDPLPPLPAGYRKTYEEFEISFNLKDLEGN
jgi:colicin import membrane protein